jgi:hypothetical protein
LIEFGPWYVSLRTACLAWIAVGGTLAAASLWLLTAALRCGERPH